MRIGNHATACDSEAARLLPWFVTGQVDADDAARVDAHVAICPVCRADLEEQRHLRAIVQSDARVEYSPQPSLQKLMSRIDELDRELTPDASAAVDAAVSAPRRAGPARWLVAALVLQTMGLALLGSLLWKHSGSEAVGDRYQTLTSMPVAARDRAQLRVVFAPGTTMSGVAGLLGELHASIVDGPSEAGAYALALARSDNGAAVVDSSLARLRSDPRVVFAEPIVGAAVATR